MTGHHAVRETVRDELESVVLGLASLLGAGVAPVSAWRSVALILQRRSRVVDAVVAGSPVEPIAARIVRATGQRGSARGLAELAHDGWRRLACVWKVAETVGAPLAVALSRCAAVERQLGEVAREIDVALAASRVSGRVLAALPALGLILGSLMGFDSLGFLVRTPIGLSLLAVASALTAASVCWRRRLADRVWPPLDLTAMHVELVALSLEGGSSLPNSHRLARDALREAFGDAFLPDSAIVDRYVSVAEATGAPLARLLVAEAQRLRANQQRDVLRRVRALDTLQLLPLGLCSLPAFFLVAVVPMVAVIMGQSASQLGL